MCFDQLGHCLFLDRLASELLVQATQCVNDAVHRKEAFCITIVEDALRLSQKVSYIARNCTYMPKGQVVARLITVSSCPSLPLPPALLDHP
jgi:hypothetical protein